MSSPTRCAAVVALAVLFVLGLAQEPSAQLRGLRYCEVLGVYLRDGALEADVWNTTSALDDCPQDEWDALDPVAIAQDLGAIIALLNGPRFWLLDFAFSLNPLGPVRTFGAINMRLSATVDIPPGGTNVPYSRRSVDRDTQFLFRSGQEVYELIDPDGRVHVMQSYSHIVDDTLDEAALAALGGRLQLPPGWAYRVRRLPSDWVVEDQDGVATVVQDEFSNSYQYTGFAEVPVAARRLTLRDDAVRASRRSLSFLLQDDPIAVPGGGSRSDPTLFGAAVQVVNPTSGEASEAVLPAGNWTRSGSGYRYLDRRQEDGPCRKVSLVPGRISGTCSGAELGFTLDEASQGSLGLLFEAGSEARYCAVAGGRIARDSGTGTDSRGRGSFVASGAPAPASCPVP